MAVTLTSQQALADIWRYSGLADASLQQISLPAAATLFPSSFATDIAAQSSIGAAALAAEAVYFERTGAHQSIQVTKPAAERECTGYFTLNGQWPNTWEKFSGLYATKDSHVRVHANFDHHRDGILQLLGLGAAETTAREEVAAALLKWTAEEFEQQAAQAGLVVAAVRTFQQWDKHPHAIATQALPLMRLTKIGDAPPQALTSIDHNSRPLTGLRVVELTRILAGPICGRTLAAYGADVMLVNAPHLPNIPSIVDTSRGKRSVHLDLSQRQAQADMHNLLGSARIFIQGYRPGAMANLGLSPSAVASTHPGSIYVSLSAYGSVGPWAARRGFDSLVQTATGFNAAEAQAANAALPRSMPLPILDYVSGFLMAYGAQAALLRQAHEGGSWLVEVSLLQTAAWLRSLGRTAADFEQKRPSMTPHLVPLACDHGDLTGPPHAAEFSTSPALWTRPSVPPGTHMPVWD